MYWKEKTTWVTKHRKLIRTRSGLKLIIIYLLLLTALVFFNTLDLQEHLNLSQSVVPFTGKRNINEIGVNPLKRAKILIGILSGRGNFKRRALARKTWIRKALSNVNKNEMIEFDIIFILGSSVCKSRECNILNSKISKENDRFKDMIFLSTVDTYKTSAMKMLEFYKFVVENFNTYSCVMKLDDDTLPNLNEIAYKLSTNILNKPNINNVAWWWGDFRFQKPEQDKSNPWYIEFSMLKSHLIHDNFLPFFASGWGHVLSINLVFYIAKDFDILDHRMWMEDAALGIWFDQLGRKYKDDIKFCRVFDSNWGAMPDFQNCKDKIKICQSQLLAIKDIVPYERSNYGKCANNLFWFETAWNNLQKCDKLCECSPQININNRGYVRITHNLCGNVLREGELYCGDSKKVLSCYA